MSERPVQARRRDGGGPVRYDSFISYGHASDGQVAKRLQDGLRRLAKPWYGRRALHIFRDTTALSVNANLWSEISGAIDASRYFILLASPTSAASIGVGRELRHWLAGRPADHILIVLTSGEIQWAEAAADFDWLRSTALHPALQGVFREEPLYLDLRWAVDDVDLNLRHPRFKEAVAALAAPIHGKPKEDLVSEDLREQRKLRRAARGGVSALSVLLVLALASTAVALQQRDRARHDAAVVNARSLSTEALGELPTGRNGLAMLLALAGNGLAPGPSTRAAVLQALEAEPGLTKDLTTTSGSVGEAAFSPDGTLLAADDGASTRVWDVTSGRQLAHPIAPPGTGIGLLAIGDNDALVTALAFGAVSDALEVSDVQTGDRVQSIPVPGTYGWTTSAATPRLAFVSTAGDAEVWDGRAGRLVRRLPAAPGVAQSAESIVPGLSADGETLAVSAIEPAASNANQYLETVDAWNVDTGAVVGQRCVADIGGPFDGRFPMNPDAPQILETLVSPDARLVTTLISGGTRGIVSRCSVASGVLSVTTATLPTPPSAPVSAITNDGSLVATRDLVSGVVRLFDASTLAEVRPSVQEPPFSPGEWGSVSFSPDGTLVAAPGSAIGELKVWHTHADIDSLAHDLSAEIPSGTALQSIGPGATSVLATTPSGEVDIVERSTRRVVVRLPASLVNKPTCAIFSTGPQFVGSGRYVALAIQAPPCQTPPSVALWDVHTGARRDITITPLGLPGQHRQRGSEPERPNARHRLRRPAHQCRQHRPRRATCRPDGHRLDATATPVS